MGDFFGIRSPSTSLTSYRLFPGTHTHTFFVYSVGDSLLQTYFYYPRIHLLPCLSPLMCKNKNQIAFIGSFFFPAEEGNVCTQILSNIRICKSRADFNEIVSLSWWGIVSSFSLRHQSTRCFSSCSDQANVSGVILTIDRQTAIPFSFPSTFKRPFWVTCNSLPVKTWLYSTGE